MRYYFANPCHIARMDINFKVYPELMVMKVINYYLIY